MKQRRITLFTLVFCTATTLFAQNLRPMVCSMVELTLEEKVAASDFVLEAEVYESSSFRNAESGRIYTAHYLHPRQLFKGSQSPQPVVVITQGGQVGMEIQTVHPCLELGLGDRGVFFLSSDGVKSIVPTGEINAFLPFGDAQGFIKYDELQGIGTDIFHSYPEIEGELYPSLSQLSGQEPSFYPNPSFELQDEDRVNGGNKTEAITSFSPGTVSAGTGTILTINGSNFLAYDGGTNSTVFFRNADDGGASFMGCPASEIISWNTAQIQLRVPSGAGTGTFVVRNSSGTTFTSASALTIDFNHLNVTFGGNELRPFLRNKNGSGGYSFQRSTNTSNSGVNFNTSAAVTPLDNALVNWQCNTQFNFIDPGTTTTSNTQDPNTNPDIAMFDNAATPLSAGVLGVAISGYSSCDGVNWFVNGVDIVFRRNGTGGITWNFGPAATTGCCVDFESVALHEMGHAHQLGHIISAGRVMHFSIGPGQDQRVLNATSDIAGGNFVMAQSLGRTTCGSSITGMTPFNCVLPIHPISFSGHYRPDLGNVLTWQAPELESPAAFVLERSEDGQHFYPISQIQAHSSADKWENYDYTDRQDLKPTLWYRLQIRELDGQISHSDILLISQEDVLGNAAIVSVFPQPFTHYLNIAIENPGFMPLKLTLVDLTGRVVAELQDAGELKTIQWECGTYLSPGMYVLNAQIGQATFSRKVIRQ